MKTIQITTTATITPTGNAGRAGTSRQGNLKGMTAKAITKALGFKPLEGADKSKGEWYFTLAGARCGIWDYKGSDEYGEFSFFGPRALMVQIFGEDHVE